MKSYSTLQYCVYIYNAIMYLPIMYIYIYIFKYTHTTYIYISYIYVYIVFNYLSRSPLCSEILDLHPPSVHGLREKTLGWIFRPN